MLSLLLKGLILGLSAGLSPGPLLGLVIRETLQYGRTAGRLAALAPLLTDTPIILASLLVVGVLPAAVAAALGFVGGLFVIWMGIDALRTRAHEMVLDAGSPLASLRRAMLTNWLSPHPWLFWLPIGGPLLLDAWYTVGLVGSLLFLGSFYLLLVGSKVILADLVAFGQGFLASSTYHRLIQASGVLLIGLGVVLIVESLVEYL